MINHILRRPIAVTMVIISIVTLGILSLQKIPISLMPDIDIPRITIQINASGSAAQEVEQRYVTPMRNQLSQVAGLKNIESTSRMDAGTITMEFETGSSMSLLFIEVNEKIDRAMNHMPKEMERPKVVKASVMDVPAFYLDIYMKDGKNGGNLSLAQLGRFVKGVVSKRIEQLPQTAMVDVSGTVGTEIECTPDYDKLSSLGLTVHDIERVIRQNNITLEALSVRDGIYHYNIHFDSQLLTKEDVANIYLKHEGRLLQLKDLCYIKERQGLPGGIVKHGETDAITMAIIKQNDAQMEDLQHSIDNLLEEFAEEYPDICFDLTRDQTRLLTYTIQNLKGNLLIGAFLACLVILVFMREWRLSLLVALSMPLSIVLTLLAFYLCGISLNIISLSGLILGVGMIVDNAIIVIDNIRSRRNQTKTESTSCHDNGETELSRIITSRTREIFTPMLSSVLTTCSVFIPLIFLSGTAGALFYDQAMGITFALFASLIVAVFVIPVYYFAFFRKRPVKTVKDGNLAAQLVAFYEKCMRYTLRHGLAITISFFCIIPLTVLLTNIIEKERMPHVAEDDTLMTIDWNQGISSEENERRTAEILGHVKSSITTSTSMMGTQEFLLSHTKDITSSEAVVYFKCQSEQELQKAKNAIVEVMQSRYPAASVEYSEPGNIYDLIFSTDESDLQLYLHTQDGHRPEVGVTRSFIDSLRYHFPETDIMPVLTETCIRYTASPEKMAVYQVSYENLYGRLKELMNRNRVFEINDGAQSVPVLVGNNTQDSDGILSATVTNSEGIEIPMSYLVEESHGEEYKRLQASGSGEYYCININGNDKLVRQVMHYVDEYTHRSGSTLSASYGGSYFSSRQMIGELAIVLLVALALLYFILAAQFESLVQPLIILLEMVVDVFFVLLGLWIFGESLNIMSMTGIVVMSGIIINDSILKVDTINRLRKNGCSPLRAVWTAGHRRLRPIVMTSLTTILAMLPFLTKGSMGSALQYPLSLSLVIGMTAGTIVSLFFVPLLYCIIYGKR